MTIETEKDERLEKMGQEILESMGMEVEEKEAPVEETLPVEKTVEKVEPQPIFEAPDTWTKEAKEGWSSLPLRVQEEVIKRESDIRKGFETIKGKDELAAFGTKFAEALAPYSNELNELGVNPLKVVQTLLQSHFGLTKSDATKKAEIFRNLANDYGIVFDGRGEAKERDPGINLLQTELNGVKSIIGQIENQRNVERHAEAVRQIEAFKQLPENRYFDEVQDLMTQLIMSKQATGLSDAYEKAIWMHAGVREKVIADRIEERQGKEKEADKVVKAKKAMGSLVKSENLGEAKQPPEGTIDEILDRELKKLRANR
jgi:hypothetical protein